MIGVFPTQKLIDIACLTRIRTAFDLLRDQLRVVFSNLPLAIQGKKIFAYTLFATNGFPVTRKSITGSG